MEVTTQVQCQEEALAPHQTWILRVLSSASSKAASSNGRCLSASPVGAIVVSSVEGLSRITETSISARSETLEHCQCSRLKPFLNIDGVSSTCIVTYAQ